MSTEALRRAFTAGWARFDTSSEVDIDRCNAEFEAWYGKELAKFDPIGLLYNREEYNEPNPTDDPSTQPPLEPTGRSS